MECSNMNIVLHIFSLLLVPTLCSETWPLFLQCRSTSYFCVVLNWIIYMIATM